MQADDKRTHRLVLRLEDAAPLLKCMRETAESTLGSASAANSRITGSKESATLPYRVDAADDADALWSELVLFTREVEERTQNPAPRPIRAFIWPGRDEPQGLPSCTPDEAYERCEAVTRYLIACARQITHDGGFGDAPDHLMRTIRRMRSRYIDAPPAARRYLDWPCPTCGERGLYYAITGYSPIVKCHDCRAIYQWEDYFT